MNKRTVKIALWHQLNRIADKHAAHHGVMWLFEDSAGMSKSRTRMRIFKGIWIVSIHLYGVEIVATASDVRVALRAIKNDMKYITYNLARVVSQQGNTL
jgi:hypothetical protein